MENVYENVKKEVSTEQIKACLQTMLTTFQGEEFSRKVEEAKTESCNDMIQLMKILFPMVIEVQTQLVAPTGLSLKEFLIRTNQVSHEDEEIRNLFLEMKSIYLPSSVYM